MIDNVIIGCEYAVREPIVAQELPYVLSRIEFGAFCGQRQEGDIGGNVELVGHVPAGLIEQEHGVLSGRDVSCDLGKVKVHRVGVALGQDQSGSFAVFRRDGAEDVGRSGALVLGGIGTRPAFRPPPRDLVLLTDTRLVCEPDLYIARVDAFFPGDFLQTCGEVFLNSSMAPSRCA